jgi:catechol 2,3-dioxygenase-like lactoylglutathione lyase family enzyme
VDTVTAQLLYEIGAPGYLGPDVVARFDTAELTQQGPDRVAITGTRGEAPPDTVKVCVNTLDGFRNGMTFILCGLDIDEKAALARRQLTAAVGADGLTWTLARTDHADADTEEAASALLHVTIKTQDPKRAKAFSRASVELALASYPGFTLTSPPGDGTPVGVYRPEYVPQQAIEQVAVLPGGERRAIDPPTLTGTPHGEIHHEDPGYTAAGPTRRVPLGTIVGARSGDKGGDANLGVWVRDPAAYPWLAAELTVDRVRELLPEAKDLDIERHPLPNLHAVNFVLHGLLGQGVAASTRFDPQAKSLGEWLRSRVVDVPEEFL